MTEEISEKRTAQLQASEASWWYFHFGKCATGQRHEWREEFTVTGWSASWTHYICEKCDKRVFRMD